MNEFRYFHIVENKAGKIKESWVYSNLYECDLLSRLYKGCDPVYSKNYNLTTRQFMILKEGLIESVVTIKVLYTDEVMKLGKEGIVKRWKRVYKI